MDKGQIKGLVQRMAADDSGAFKAFFDLLYPRFYRLAFYYVKSDVLSEELVSDVFMKMWNNRKRLAEIQQLDYYFFQAVKHQAFTYLKRESRHSSLDYSQPKSSRIEYNEPEKLMLARELAVKIEEAIQNLPDKCQMIFRLVREEELSYKEVAELLDIAPKTVENQMHIALKKLKAALDEYQKHKSNPSFIPLWYALVLTDALT